MSKAFIHGFIASEVLLRDYTLPSIKQKYGTIENIDQFIKNEKQRLRDSMLKMGLEAKHLDLLYAIDDYQLKSEEAMVASIKSYQGCEAGNAYRDCFITRYAYYQAHREQDYELKFDLDLMKTMEPYLQRYVDDDGIIAYLFFRLMELKNVAIVIKADHYKINPETRIRRI